jgi:hypothetical protein
VNRGIDFHDSEVTLIERLHDSVRVSFGPAYVHVSPGRPGIDAGEGHVQPAELVFAAAECDGVPTDCAGAISDGEVSVDGVTYSLLPVPFAASGAVSAKFVFCSGAILKLTAKSVSCSLHGPSRFVESFAA